MKKISFIIPVKNRDHDRLQRCVDSLQSKWTEEVIVVDYKSIPAIKDIKGARIIRYIRNDIWNKAHAINLGIKEAKGKYIGTVDCDMIIHPMFIQTAISYLDRQSFLYTLNVRRVKKKYFGDNFFSMRLKSEPWIKGWGRRNFNHSANGGIQIYSKIWIRKIWGLDESLIYWGGMDNDIVERAFMSGKVMINLNLPILHQEHPQKKEEHLTGQEKIDAFRIRVEKIKYLDKMFKDKKVKRNRGGWGKEIPNQRRFLKMIEKIKEKELTVQDLFIRAIKKKQSSLEVKGVTHKIFR